MKKLAINLYNASNKHKQHTYKITARSRTIDWIVIFIDEEIPPTRTFLALDAWCIVF